MTSNNSQSGRGINVPYHLDDESQQNGDVEEFDSSFPALLPARDAIAPMDLSDEDDEYDDWGMGYHSDLDPSDPSHISELNLNSLCDEDFDTAMDLLEDIDELDDLMGPSDRGISMPNPPHVRRP